MRTPRRQIALLTVAMAILLAAVLSDLWPRPSLPMRAVVLSTRSLADGLSVRDVTVFPPSDRGGPPFTIHCVSGDARRWTLVPVDVRPFPSSPLRHALDATAAACAVNGGYFDTGFAPLGLLRNAGVTLTAPATRPVLTACLITDSNTRLVAVDDPATSHAPAARQCGPFLIGPGPAAGNRTARAARTVVATSDTRLAVMTTEAVSLDDLAAALAEYGPALGCGTVTRAANLDGGPSTGMVMADDPAASHEPRGRITDALVMVEHAPVTRP